MKKKIRRQQSRQAGFTLIELVMVLVIITALAALVIPVIDYIRRTSDKASASFAISQVAENVAMYRTINGTYPSGLDALIDEDGTTLLATGPWSASKLAVTDLSASGTYLNKADDMFGTVMLHDTDNSSGNVYRDFPGNSGIIEAAVGGSGQTSFVVVVNEDILQSVYPGGSATALAPTTGALLPHINTATGLVTLGAGADGDAATAADNQSAYIVVLGIGPANEAVGKTMVTAPAYTHIDGTKKYNRFLAMFAFYDGFTVDKRPQLKGALDTKLDFLDQELIEVFENTID